MPFGLGYIPLESTSLVHRFIRFRVFYLLLFILMEGVTIAHS
jgi:hypothetical protein